MPRLIVLVVGLVVFGACSKKPDRAAPADTVTLAFVSGLGGTTAPCGCTSKPLGGLDKVAALVDKLGRDNAAFGFVVVGDTFVEHADPPAHLFDAERQKAGVIVDLLAGMHPLAVLRGPRDLGVQSDKLVSLAKDARLPLFAAPRSEETRSRADTRLVTLGGMKVGFIGVPGSAAGEASSYTGGALALRAQGADFVVALVPEGAAKALALAPELDRIDVIVSGGGDELAEPRIVDEALVVEAGDRGRYVGVLTLHKKGKGAWVYDDQGKTRRRAVQKRLGGLKVELEAMADGEGKTARLKKLQELEAELQKPAPTTPPTGRYVTFDTLEVTKDLPSAKWASDKLKAYDLSLCDLNRSATASRHCEAAPTPRDAYVGTDACKACHAAAYAVWQGTKHAHAWATLVDAGKTCDLGCIGCHTVGFERPGGYCKLGDAERQANVGCEMCHGPGAGHAQNPGDRATWSASFARSPDAATCRECHNEEHSDTFDFATYRPRILGPGHGQEVEAATRR